MFNLQSPLLSPIGYDAFPSGVFHPILRRPWGKKHTHVSGSGHDLGSAQADGFSPSFLSLALPLPGLQEPGRSGEHLKASQGPQKLT